MTHFFQGRRWRGGGPNAAAATVASLGMTIVGGAGLSGCGGGNSNGSTNAATTPIHLTIDWAARSKNVSAPSSALVAIVSLSRGNTNGGGSIDFPPIIRSSAPAAYSQTWTSASDVRVGLTTVNVRFYARQAAANPTDPKSYAPDLNTPSNSVPVVADATQQVTINNDGSGIGTITTTKTVAKVTVAPDQSVNFGSLAGITFTAFDSSNKVVAVSAGSAFFATDQNQVPAVTPDGNMSGTGLGHANVIATVDGVSSPLTRVNSIVGSNALTTAGSGLQFRDTQAGTGAVAAPGMTVQVDYAGYLDDGNLDDGNYTLFDTSVKTGGSPLVFTLGSGQVIPGFDETISGALTGGAADTRITPMKVGGTRIVVIPAALAYGPNPPAGSIIPPNARLIFIIQLKAAQ